MKKNYQVPETDIVTVRTSSPLQEEIENSGTGIIIQGNENNTFEDNELSTDMNKSGLWED